MSDDLLAPVSETIDERIVAATTAALEMFSIHIGDKLGLYGFVHEAGSVTSAELATAAAIDERYAREWLEQQAVAGLLAVVEPSNEALLRRYALPAEHVGALVDRVHPAHVAPLARMVAGIGGALDEVVHAYRTGGGVPYAKYGPDFRSGQGDINRPAFSTSLTGEWLPAVPGLPERLARGGKIADLGCGEGWSTIAMARAFPDAHVVGIDADIPSIGDAVANARREGVAARFVASDAAALVEYGPFDVVTILEALHDMANPVDVLAAARDALARDGWLVIADEAVAGSFTAPGDLVERMMYGWSVAHCLPAAMAEQPSAAIGTVIREHTVRALAEAAGFRTVSVLPVDGGFFRIYACEP